MKKILAVLVVLAMVLSLSAVAFAEDTGVAKLTASATTQTRFQYQMSGIPVANGDEIVILVQLPDITDAASGETAKVGKLTARVYGAGSKFVDAKSFDETWVKDLGNDWYELTFTATADSAAGLMVAFFYYTEGGVEAQPVDGSVMNVASITVGDTTYAFTDAAKVEAAGFVGEGLALAAEAATVAAPVEGGNDEDTEDVTEGVEETGVVSVAVVAVAAVVGGAVVLKKREF